MTRNDSDPHCFSSVLTSLDGLLEVAWSQLEVAADSPAHGWHWPVLATVQNGTPRARTIVLRGVDRADRSLWCHTDARSAKVDEICQQPEVAWSFYDANQRVQATLLATATVHVNDEIAEAAWRASRLETLRCYLAPQPPGVLCDEPTVNLPPQLVDRPPTADEVSEGREHFAVIRTLVTSLEVLVLQQTGNVRAQFVWTAHSCEANWVTP